MEISSALTQQAPKQQLDTVISMVKKSAESDRAVVQLVEEAIKSAGTAARGQNLDITV